MCHLQKTKQECSNSKKQNTPGIYRNERDKACFQQDLAYRDFEYLPRRTLPTEIMLDKALKFSSDHKYDVYQRGIA